MWHGKSGGEKKLALNQLVAVAIDKDKCSQYAIKWTIDNLVAKDSTVILIHVLKPSSNSVVDANNAAVRLQKKLDKETKDLFIAFHCLCTRKSVRCYDVVLEDKDIVKALTEYVSYSAIEDLVMGAPSRNGFFRKFITSDIASSVSKTAPDFCNIHVISKGKVTAVRNASRVAPPSSPLRREIEEWLSQVNKNEEAQSRSTPSLRVPDRASFTSRTSLGKDAFRSPFRIGRILNGEPEAETDISFVSSDRPSSVDRMSPLGYDYIDLERSSRISTSTDHSVRSNRIASSVPNLTLSSNYDFSYVSHEDESDSELFRLRLELDRTIELYNSACKEAVSANKKASDLHRWRVEEERKLEEAQNAEEAALSMFEKEKAKRIEALEEAEAAQRLAEMEARKRKNVELKAHREAEEMKKILEALSGRNVRYRKYSIEEIQSATEGFHRSRMIGEGGYGPVFKCNLDHTLVAVKVLRPDATQGRLQFQQELELLSCIRHPNMVLLLGACPEYGCLVYEYMANGSLDDRLFRRGNTPALSWRQRFRIAAEIATGLLFLHQTKPEPIVHRDLKPANILLDHNFVSKIADVGLARLVPAAIADGITQYHLTSTAGTFCYIDPEYQQTGMLGVKSDVYSIGILLLQLITAKPPMGLTHHVQRSIDEGTFASQLDPEVPDWPVEEALSFARLALNCAELRRKDRPDLRKVILPELTRLRGFADGGPNLMLPNGDGLAMQDVISESYESSRAASNPDRPQ